MYMFIYFKEMNWYGILISYITIECLPDSSDMVCCSPWGRLGGSMSVSVMLLSSKRLVLIIFN